MSDILFRYLLMARKRDRSRFRRLFFADEQLLEAGVEELVESAVARVEVYSQHERVGKKSVTVPASRRNAVRFYDTPEPNRPRPGNFEQREEEFALRATLRVYTCTECSGTGEVRCRKCVGRGKVRCWRCSGSGRVHDGHRRRRCRSCRGSGDRICPSCHGSGWKTCGLCRGERELASWEAETYTWLIEKREEASYPRDDDRLRSAFRRWLEVHRDLARGFDAETAAEHLGYRTPDAMEVAARADATRLRLEGEARQSSDRFLFHRSDCLLAPAGYTVVRLGGRARTYWLVGRGEKAVEIRPRRRIDGRKLLGLFGLGSGGAATWEWAVRGAEWSALEVVDALQVGLIERGIATVVDGFQIFDAVPGLPLAGATAASVSFLVAGARRWFAEEDPVRTVALLPVSGQPTPWLTCLAYLGSYTGRLKVLDRAYDTQLERLLGKMRPARQSESLSVEIDDLKVRLVEVARPAELPDGYLELMPQALDGVLILEEGERGSDTLEGRLRAVADGGKATLPIGKAAIERSADVGPAGGRGVPVEAIRRAFVEDLSAEVAWDEHFERLWRPVEKVLNS